MHLNVVGPVGQRLISGFVGQRIAVLPRDVVLSARTRPLTRGLLPTDVGYFPKAANHLAERPRGASQTIFIYCISGRGWCELFGRRHDIEQGQLLVIPATVPHRYGAANPHPWTIFWVHALGDQLPAYLSALGANAEQSIFFLGEDILLNTLFEEVLGELEGGYTQLNLLYASQALAHLLGAMIRRRHQRWTGSPDPQQKIVQSITMMNSNLNKSVQISHLAAAANLSAQSFARLFKHQTGFSPKAYFTRLKMHKASQLLDTTTLSAKEIAFQVGYDDPLHFSRVFKLINNVSPKAYRERHKG